MLSRTPILPLALLGILASAGWVKAANAMELAEAYRRAQQHDARFAAARAAHSAGREQLPQARARLLPTVTLEAGKTSYDASVTYQGNTTFQGGDRRYENREYGISLTQPLYQRSLYAAYRQSESRVALAEAEFQLAQHDLILRVTQVYFEMLAAQDSHRLVLSQQSTYQTQFDQAQARLTAGAGTRIEVSETRARLDITISQEIAARNEVDVRRQTLWKLTGQQVSQLPEMDKQQTPKPPEPAQVEKWLALGEEKNPRLNALRHAVNAAEQEIQVARGAHHPTLRSQRRRGQCPFHRQRLHQRRQRQHREKRGRATQDSVVPGRRGQRPRARSHSAARQSARGDGRHAPRGAGAGPADPCRHPQRTGADPRAGLAEGSSEEALKASRVGLQVGSRNILDVFNAETQRKPSAATSPARATSTCSTSCASRPLPARLMRMTLT